MNRVWIVERGYDYEGSDVKEICLTEAIAIREAKRLVEEEKKNWSWMEDNDWNHHTDVGSNGQNIHRWASQMSTYFVVYSSEVITK